MASRLAHLIRSNVVLFVALAVALTVGAAYAATTAPKNSVTSKSIKNGQVKNKDLAKQAVKAKNVKPNTLTGAQIDESSLDRNVLQRRIADACPSGQALTAVGSDGTITCTTTGGPPSGTAGGDLSGIYPNPQIALGAVGTNKLTDLAVITAKLAEHAVTGDKVAHDTLTGTNIDESTLGVVPSATDADTLDGINSTGFLEISDSAGGDVSGLFSNLQIGASAVGNSEIAGLSITDAKIASANKDGTAATPSMRTLGSGAQQAVAGNDARLSDSRTPTGTAGGALAGTFPNPTLNVSGGPCANGRAMTNLSSGGAISCAPGVYSDGSLNVAAGPTSFPALTTGNWNSALGSGALAAVTSGFQNTAVGKDALQGNTTGGDNTALGSLALRANTTGFNNTAMGQGALSLNTTGGGNTAIGYTALVNNTGGHNTALGQNAGFTLTTGDYNIDIGNSGVAGESNTTRIGTAGSQTRAFVAGISGVTTGGVAAPVLVDANGQLGTTSSSRRFKRDIEPLDQASRKLMELNPVSFRYKKSYTGGKSSRQFGLLAEQVAKVYPNLVVYGKDGKPSAIAYQELPALLLAQAQRQEVKDQSQQARIEAQQARIGRQHRQTASLRDKVRWLMQHTRSR